MTQEVRPMLCQLWSLETMGQWNFDLSCFSSSLAEKDCDFEAFSSLALPPAVSQ